MHIPSLDYGYLQSYCQTCWYLQYQTLMLIQTDSSLPCKRGKRLLRLARPSSNSTASHHSHYTAHPSPHLGGTRRYKNIRNYKKKPTTNIPKKPRSTRCSCSPGSSRLATLPPLGGIPGDSRLAELTSPPHPLSAPPAPPGCESGGTSGSPAPGTAPAPSQCSPSGRTPAPAWCPRPPSCRRGGPEARQAATRRFARSRFPAGGTDLRPPRGPGRGRPFERGQGRPQASALPQGRRCRPGAQGDAAPSPTHPRGRTAPARSLRRRGPAAPAAAAQDGKGRASLRRRRCRWGAGSACAEARRGLGPAPGGGSSSGRWVRPREADPAPGGAAGPGRRAGPRRPGRCRFPAGKSPAGWGWVGAAPVPVPIAAPAPRPAGDSRGAAAKEGNELLCFSRAVRARARSSGVGRAAADAASGVCFPAAGGLAWSDGTKRISSPRRHCGGGKLHLFQPKQRCPSVGQCPVCFRNPESRR